MTGLRDLLQATPIGLVIYEMQMPHLKIISDILKQ
jgi:hypothetical protein